MSSENPSIDNNRRAFIKASLALAGAFVLGKVSGILSWPSGIGTATPTISTQTHASPIMVKEYKNARYGFSLVHPSSLAVAEHSEGGGATTITFQNPGKAEGFQLFIVPHSDSQVSDERFNQDVPSGVRESLTNIAVDGATGAEFYSTHPALGDTHEVWLTRGGFLYELTTFKSLDTWLNSIVPTLKFV